MQDNNNNNNNKRKLENDDDNNNKFTYKKFKELNYKTVNYKKLQTIAGSFGILKNGKKEELYKKIEDYFKLKETIKDESNIEFNSFNKQAPSLLLNIQGIDLTIELPFWKVFRNKSIFKNIFSNFKESNTRFSYQYLFNLNKLLNNFNNGIEILSDKLKCGNYQLINNTNEIGLVFKKLSDKDDKNNQFNRSFLNQIFQIYTTPELFNCNGIYKTTSLIQFNNIEKWVPAIMGIENWLILDQYINYFKLEIDQFKQFIIQRSPQLLENKQFRFYSYLLSKGYIKFEDIKNGIVLLNEDFILCKIKFKELIKKFKTVSSFLESSDAHSSSSKSNKLKLELNQIDINQFKNNKSLWNNTIYYILKSSDSTTTTTTTATNNINSIIKKFYKFFYFLIIDLNLPKFSFGLRKYCKMYNNKPIGYYLHFKNKETIYKMIQEINSSSSSSSSGVNNKILPLNYYGILIEITFKNNENDIIELLSTYLKHQDEISIIYGDLNKYIFSCNNLKVIDYYLKEIVPKFDLHFNYQQLSIKKFICNGFSYCKTKEMVDYLFENYRDVLIDNGLIYKDFELLDQEIILYFESLLEKSGKIINFNISNSGDWYKSKILNRAIQKQEIYSFNSSLGSSFYINPFNHDNIDENSIISLLSNLKFRNALHINSYSYNLNPSKALLEFIFQGVSIELIEKELLLELSKLIYQGQRIYINIVTLLTDGGDGSGGGEDNEMNSSNLSVIVGKPKKIKFLIPLGALLYFLSVLGRNDDIIRIITISPKILDGSLNLHDWINKLSNHSIDKCITYLSKALIIKDACKLDNTTILFNLYTFFNILIRKGCDVSIFKNLISNDLDHVFKIDKSKKITTQKFFQEATELLFNENNFQLFYLFIKTINFPTKFVNSFESLFNDLISSESKNSLSFSCRYYCHTIDNYEGDISKYDDVEEN